MIPVFHTLESFQAWRAELSARTVGFVPTMGALHEGHRSLFVRARAENQCVIASVFVNPAQFDNPIDLERYPRTLPQDLAVMEGLVDAVLAPPPAPMYADGYRYRVIETEASRRMEGAHRPGHFDGVLTVVLKLLNLVAPHRAYFGEKDRQQLELVRGMVDAFFLPVEILACPTVRAADGLALSSRNARLSPDGLRRAALFPKILKEAASAAAAEAALRAACLEPDYVEDAGGIRLGAVRLEGVRLIDNVRL